MLHSIGTESQRFERIVNYWPVYAPQLEGAICTLLRAVTAAITRQCGLLPSMQLYRPATSFGRTPARYGAFAACVIEQPVGTDQVPPVVTPVKCDGQALINGQLLYQHSNTAQCTEVPKCQLMGR